MSKEMFISSSPHETKVAVLEDDQLVEVHFERDTDVGLVGGIYKGRVNRVLPGMQSAFVDIGLERDAFLYVSDFFYEDQEEYDKVFEEAEARATKFTAQEEKGAAVIEASAAPATPPPTEVPTPAVAAIAPVEAPASEPPAPPAPPAPSTPPRSGRSPYEPRERRGGFDQSRGRRRRHRGRPGFDRYPERRFTPPVDTPEPPHSFEVLPGESLAKYSHAAPHAHDASAPAESSNGLESPAEALAGIASHTAEPSSETSVYAPDQESSFVGEYAEVSEPVAAIAPGPVDAGSVAPEIKEPDSPKSHTEKSGTASVESVADAYHEAPAAESATSAFSVATPNDPLERQPERSARDFAPPYSPAEEETGTEDRISQPAVPQVALEADAGIADFDESDEDEELSESEGAAEFVATEAQAGSESGVSDAPAEAGAGTISGAAPGGESSDRPADRTYTLRDQHERPRFAPRRRRGRRGQGGRRYDNRKESSRPGNHQPVQISEVLKEGQEIIVQIAKEPLGTKGARITSHVALPGRYLVYMPTIDHIGVSRKIASEEERLRLRNIILENKGALTGGFIVRTAGQGRSEEEFKADLTFLSTLWNEMRSKAERLKAPALLHRDLDLVQRLLRDLLTPDFKTVRVDSEIDYERVLEFVNRCQPALIGKVKLYSRDTPLFEEFGLQQELEKALKPKVWLKSGGYIVINQTEALVAVDVNTGKYVGKTNRLEDTILKTNVDAVNEIVRQVRLRDLGGIIVIDFIDMDERKNRAKVVQALEEALHSDRAPTKVISFHDFGLVAVTRKRVKQSLERTLCEPCDYCSGSGWIKSVNTICNEILAEARKMARDIDGNVVTLRVNPEVAKALKSREGALLSELESLTKKDVIVKSDAAVHQERFEIF